MRGIVFNDAYEHSPFHPALSYCFLDVSTSNYRAHLVVAAQVVLTGFGWLQNNVTHRGGRKKKRAQEVIQVRRLFSFLFFFPNFPDHQPQMRAKYLNVWHVARGH